MKTLAIIALTGAMLSPSTAHAADAKRSTFGTLPDGRPVPAVTLSNGAGVSATVIAYGAALQSLVMPDRDGKLADVALSYGSLAEFLANPQYFGATVAALPIASRAGDTRSMARRMKRRSTTDPTHFTVENSVSTRSCGRSCR